MKLQDYLDQLTTALLSTDGVIAVGGNQNRLDADTWRVVCGCANGRRITHFVSREDVAGYESFADGRHLARIVKAITAGLEKAQ